MKRQIAPAIVSAAAVVIAGLPALWLLTLGALASHMVLHIAVMGVATPLVAMLFIELGAARTLGPKWLWASTVLQLVALWGLHAPDLHNAPPGAASLSALLWTLLIASAVIFWLSVCSSRPAQWWQAILALLVTGKLACLLGALLVFAPQPVYAALHHGFDLVDQQMAGLLMLAACPLSYVLAGIAIAVETLFAASDRTGRALGQPALVRQTA